MRKDREKSADFGGAPLFLVFALLAGFPSNSLAQQPGATDPPVLNNVEAAFARIETRGAHVTACAGSLIPKPEYRSALNNFLFGLRNHFQGIQRLADGFLAMSGANRHSSDLFLIRLPKDDGPSRSCDGEVVSRIELDPVAGHAGGLSVLGSMLAVPIHGGSPRVAKVVFFDVAQPDAPWRLPFEIVRPGRKASAAAVTRLPNRHYLVAVLAQFDGLPLRLDFYLSRSTALDDGFLPDPVMWRVSAVEARPNQERTFSHFQSIIFVRQADGRLYLVGFHNSIAPQTILPGRDYADLYEVVFPKSVTEGSQPVLVVPALVKVASRRFQCRDGYCNLDAAAGLFIDPATRDMSIYAAPGWIDGDTVKVTIYPSGSGDATDAP